MGTLGFPSDDARSYAGSLRTLLWEQLLKIVQLRAPSVVHLLNSPEAEPDLPAADASGYLHRRWQALKVMRLSASQMP